MLQSNETIHTTKRYPANTSSIHKAEHKMNMNVCDLGFHLRALHLFIVSMFYIEYVFSVSFPFSSFHVHTFSSFIYILCFRKIILLLLLWVFLFSVFHNVFDRWFSHRYILCWSFFLLSFRLFFFVLLRIQFSIKIFYFSCFRFYSIW